MNLDEGVKIARIAKVREAIGDEEGAIDDQEATGDEEGLINDQAEDGEEDQSEEKE